MKEASGSLKPAEVVRRIEIGREFMEPLAIVDRNQSRKFCDPTAEDVVSLDEPIYTPVGGGSTRLVETRTEVPEGVVNQLAANILVKVAAIGVGEPALRVRLKPDAPEEYAGIVEAYFRHVWRHGNMRFACAHAITKRSLCGLGLCFYRWDSERAFVLEPVQTWDTAFDPFVTDWHEPDWAARRIQMSKRRAIDLYGRRILDVAEASDDDASLDSQPISIWLYWDRLLEQHVCGDEVVNTPGHANLYGRVPVIALVGDYDPGPSPFPLGDVQLGAGLQAALTELWLGLYYTARNGGPINVVDASLVGGNAEDAWQRARQTGVFMAKGAPNQVYARYPGETVSPALMPAAQQFIAGLDALMGVTQYDRGVVDSPARFATEAVMAVQRSGARAVQNRIDFEAFVRTIAYALIDTTRRFGGPQEGRQRPPEVDILWEACLSVDDIEVVAASTAYKDPMTEQQPMLALLQSLAQLAPLMAQSGQPVPNLKALADDVLRAFGKTDTDKYWIFPQTRQEVGE